MQDPPKERRDQTNRQVEDLYFGSVAAFFTPVPGAAHPFNPNSHLKHKSDDAASQHLKQLSLDRLQPASFLGQDYSNLILPAIAALDITVIPESSSTSPKSSGQLPQSLERPLLKVDAEDRKEGIEYISGLQSGRRSALIRGDGRWFRLKGCGDLGNGFPLRQVETPPKGAPAECWEIRGCMFEHTVSREMLMTHEINDILCKDGLLPANIPLGWWEYERKQSDPYPAVKRCCGIYETKGDKRLGDHVIVGLERLLDSLVGDRLDTESLLKIFGEKRRQLDPPAGDGRDTVFETWVAVLTEGESGDLVDALGFVLDERVPNIEKVEVPSHLKETWIEACKLLEEQLQRVKTESGVGSVLAYLYWRFGREAGTIQRLLRKHDISWGTYVDPLGTHCNSHPNNLILLPKGESKELFLAPLDFDMAFTRDTFNRDEATYNEWMFLEDRALKLALAGDENLSTGMRGFAVLDKKLTLLKWALRDTMVLGFISGFEGQEDKHPAVAALWEVSHALLTIALTLTSQDIA